MIKGIHMQMALVVCLICIVIYVYYVSKDILTMDREIRNIKTQLNEMKLAAGGLNGSAVCEVGVNANGGICNVGGGGQSQGDIVGDGGGGGGGGGVGGGGGDGGSDSDSDSDGESDTDFVQSSNLDINTIIEGVEEIENEDTAEVSVVEGEPMKSMTIMELRKACKDHGISGKGSKQELLERLNNAE
jgi:hypothetical protein